MPSLCYAVYDSLAVMSQLRYLGSRKSLGGL